MQVDYGHWYLFSAYFRDNKSNKKDLILFILLLIQDRRHKLLSDKILLNSSEDLKTSTSIKANRLRAQRHSRTIRLQVTKYLCRNYEQEKPTSIRRFRRSVTSLCALSVACSSFAQSSQVYVLMISGLQTRSS